MPKDESLKLAEEMAALCRRVADTLPLTEEQLNIADDISVELANMARQI